MTAADSTVIVGYLCGLGTGIGVVVMVLLFSALRK